MSLADVTSHLAQELAQLRCEQATLIGDLAQAKATLAARERQVELLVEQLETTGQALETAARRAVMAELAHAGAETSLGAVRAEAAILRAERDTARRAGWALTQELGVLEGALATGWLRRTRKRRTAHRPEGAVVLTVALGLARAALPAIIRMVRAQAARRPLLLIVDHDLDAQLDPAPAAWLRLPALRELPRALAADRTAYLRGRLALLIETLQPTAVVPLGALAAQLLGPDRP